MTGHATIRQVDAIERDLALAATRAAAGQKARGASTAQQQVAAAKVAGINSRRVAERTVPGALSLIRLVREATDHEPIARATDHMTHAELVALAVVLAALVPADVDPDHALAWCDLPPSEWPEPVLVHERRRHDNGARDAVAVIAATEYRRRVRALDVAS